MAQNSAAQASTAPTIAILPILNTSGEKWEDLKRKQADKMYAYSVRSFEQKGFKVVPQAAVLEAIKANDVDLSDEENLKRATFFQVAKAVSADFVYVAQITNTEQKEQKRDLYEDREGRTDVKVWFLDVKAEKPILSAKTFIGRSGGMRITLRPSDRQIQAAENAVRDSLNEAWKSWPKVGG